MCNFWAQNSLFPRTRIFSENLLIPCFFHSCLSTYPFMPKSDNLLVKYWQLKNTETSLAERHFQELDFPRAWSFGTMLMNHNNFHFTQIPDKTNDLIFLKSPKTMFSDHFWSFLPNGNFFQKIRLCHVQLYMVPGTMLSFRRN